MNVEILNLLDKRIRELENIIGIANIDPQDHPKKISQELTDIQTRLNKELNASDKSQLDISIKKCNHQSPCIIS